MSFMQPQITNKRNWYAVDGTDGMFFYDVLDFNEEQLKDCYPGDVVEIEMITGYGARLSAPGYMDCTEWSVFDTELQAAEYLIEMFCEMEDDAEDPDFAEIFAIVAANEE